MGPAITFQFQSLDDLWAFRIEALIYFIDMDKNENTLTCKCSPEHIRLAVSKYKAVILLQVNPLETEL